MIRKEEKVNTLASAPHADKTTSLDNFNNAYESIRQVNDRLVTLIMKLKGEDCPIAEKPPNCHCIQNLFINMPDNIQTECRGINDYLTELEQILLT